ncbi:hypothetical protein CAPTEDRAFT_188768 [Capitella teleta]|uniref:Uncharacterized protein n=1 Tax=Capitella teleta TaxID=283909 RepID=R7V4E0_CAPTE|nr:hypothetical protein CAPTEDRAFT_188768 [Capitella teleta]|eukprot:ELU13444.1 hypothetical protein CAPTEDRAFT_188768 [Capitella teleta]
MHLMQGCRSTSTTPAKTPGSLKLKKWASRSKKQKPNACSTPVSNNRLQLFGGTQENSSAVSLDSFKNLDDTNSPIVSSVNESKNSQKETPTDFHVYRKPKFSSQERDSYSSRSQRNLSFQSQQNSAPRSKQCSLGDFLLSPEANTRQTKQSPHAPRHKDKPSPMQRHKKKPQRVDDSRNSSAVFNLSDFPSMEESLKQPSQAKGIFSALTCEKEPATWAHNQWANSGL